MKAAVYYGPGDVRLEERPEPEAHEDNFIAEVAFAAICGTDVKLATIGHSRWKPGTIVGHEFCGRLTHVGRSVSGYSVGDRITMATTLSCNECPTCARGLQNMCPNNTPISIDYDGAFAKSLAIPPLAIAGGNVVKVPDSVSDEEAALSEPMSCAINAQEIANVKPGDTVLIIGGGPLGALHAEIAKAHGAKKVMITQRSEPRLSMLCNLKDVLVIDGKRDVIREVKEQTAGFGADVVIVCAPNREAQEQSIHLARKGGTISLFASLPKGDSNITLDNRAIHYNELRVLGCSDSRPEQVRKAVQCLSEKRLDVTPVITHKLPLDRIHDGIELMKRKESLKVLLCP